MDIHLIDGTYELFRHYHALPSARDAAGHEVAAVRGVLRSVLGMISGGGATHVAVATDHIIESFRNRLWPGYKTGAGIEPDLLAQFPLLESALAALVGDAADGYPGLPGWGAKSAAAVLARFKHLEAIPADWRLWSVNAVNPGALAQTLQRERDHAFLFRDLATLRTDIALFESVDQ